MILFLPLLRHAASQMDPLANKNMSFACESGCGKRIITLDYLEM